jgi:hypothetical protein
VRGSQELDVNVEMIEAIMMSRYNQQFSELQNIPLRNMMFYVELYQAENQYIEQEQERETKKIMDLLKGKK